MFVLVPYTVDPEDGSRRPDIPSSWERWGQWTSRTDTYGAGQPRRVRRASIWVEEPVAVVEAWATVRSDVEIVDVPDADTLLTAARGEGADERLHRASAQRELKALAMETVDPYVRAMDEDDERDTRDRILRTGTRAIAWLAIHVGVYAATRFLGVSLEHVVTAQLISVGTTLVEADWLDMSDDQDAHGHAPNIIDPGGGAMACIVTANGIEFNDSDSWIQNDGASSTSEDALWHAGMASLTDQFSETIDADGNTPMPAVRLSNMGVGATDGYCVRVRSARIFRIDNGTQTQIATGSNSGPAACRLEVVDDDLTCWSDTSGAYIGASVEHLTQALNDTNYTSGVPGAYYTLNGSTTRLAKWRGGSLGAAGGVPWAALRRPAFFTHLRR